ncbi:MAG: MoxR family ATPase [Chloroflexaceae bacterium]|jgi:MoxR-like ATPase|nr:MoxR family ATPase [Chloroflexaceae bacterium]
MLPSVEATAQALAQHAYIADTGLSTSLFLALRMGKALLLEGEPGVGKTEIAKVLSRVFDTPLIRLQCYEGIDISQAVYEWNYPRQLLALQSSARDDDDGRSEAIYSEHFLLKRPLLQAIDQANSSAPILLIDELDRADEEFESFLLELLSDFQITIPELGTLRARHRPIVIITSNRTRELHDALKRRCVYHWIDYPTREKELAIVCCKLPGISQRLAAQVVDAVQTLRRHELAKNPGVAETLDWCEALQHLNARELSPELVLATLGVVLKYQDDVDKLRGGLINELVQEGR